MTPTLWGIFSLVNSHNLLASPLLFPTEITNLLFVIKNRQPLKQNFMLNCKRTTIKKKELLSVLYFVTLRYGILTIGTWDSFFPSSCFSGQNGMFSATEQNAIQITILFFLEDRIQFSSISSAKAASMSPAN